AWAAAEAATSAAVATPLPHLRHHRKIPARRLRGRRQRRESLLRVGAAPIGQRAGDLLLVQAKQLQTDLGVGQPRNRRQLLHPGIGLRRPRQVPGVAPPPPDGRATAARSSPTSAGSRRPGFRWPSPAPAPPRAAGTATSRR